MHLALRSFTLAVAFTAPAFGGAAAAAPARLPHYDLEMTSAEYRPHVEALLERESDAVSPELQRLLELGARNLEWLAHINARRDASQQLELSTPGTQKGIPIDEPSRSNEALILEKYDAWLTATDAGVTTVILSDVPFPDQAPVADEVYLQAARDIDRIYQHTSRWILQLPWRDEYKAQQRYDVRGYYFLNQEQDLGAKLDTWTTLGAEDRARLEPLLVGICFNDEAMTLDQCRDDLATAAADGTVRAYFDRYFAGAKDLWDSYFAIPASRRDVTWTSAAPEAFRIPFRYPEEDAVTDWLRTNIEDEFRWQGWQLHLDFVHSDDDETTHIVFEPGVTPHVNELGGSIITMDANRSIDEYSSRWTIRHEYGHVLGLPDCYVEFYDDAAGVMVNYQLDVDNLMCSRRGKFQQRHYDELKRIYFTAD